MKPLLRPFLLLLLFLASLHLGNSMKMDWINNRVDSDDLDDAVSADGDSDVSATSTSTSPVSSASTSAAEDSLESLSSSSSESNSKESEEVENQQKKQDDDAIRMENCMPDRYMDANGACKLCSLCGSDLYIRTKCQVDKDTDCDWCFNRFAIRNEDFFVKCSRLFIPFQMENVNSEQIPKVNDGNSSAIMSIFHIGRAEIKSYLLATISPTQSSWLTFGVALEICFYLLLIALVFSAIRFLAKLSKRKSHRTVHITTPPLLSEEDHKHIIRAAELIREKMGKKNYEQLEEFI